MSSIKVRTPGKIHLIGEHSVVYGYPAIIAAIDKYSTIEVSEGKENTVEIYSKNFDEYLNISFSNLEKKLKIAMSLWEKFIKTKDTKILGEIIKDKLDYPTLAVGVCLSKLIIKSGNGLKVVIESDIPVGSGLGSSASIAVGMIRSLSEFFENKLNEKEIFEIAFEIEKLKHGTPSGGDPAICIQGGFLWYQNKNNKKVFNSLDIRLDSKISSNFYLIDTGKPVESTGEMIGVVRDFKSRNPDRAEKIFRSQQELTIKLKNALRNNNESAIVSIVNKAEENLEKLGVVSDFVKGIIMETEKTGGAAKISGGGGIQRGTGIVLAYSREEGVIANIVKNYKLSYFRSEIGIRV